MAVQERTTLAGGFKLEIDNQVVTHLTEVHGAKLIIPQVNVSHSDGKEQEFTAGRIDVTPLTVKFYNAKDNLKFIQNAIKYAKDPMGSPRSTIAVSAITQSNTAGSTQTLYECFCTDIDFPDFNNNDGTLETTMVFCCERSEFTAGGRGV